MLDPEQSDGDNEDLPDSFLESGSREPRPPSDNLAVRRRIEQIRELKRLRELLDDPDFNDLL